MYQIVNIYRHYFILVLLLVLGTAYGQPKSITVCETTGPGTITCPLGKSIDLVTIVYGRTHILPTSTCNPYKTPITNFNCVGGSQSSNQINKLCQGKSTCTVTNSYMQLGDPCAGVPKFLKIDYQCIVPTLPPTTTTGTTTPTVKTTATTTRSVKTTIASTTTKAGVVTYKTTTLAPSQRKQNIFFSVLHLFHQYFNNMSPDSQFNHCPCSMHQYNVIHRM